MNDPRTSADCALLVLSCDPYSDLWPPFFTLLERYWPDCPFPLYLGAGAATFNSPAVTMLRSNAGRDWSQCVMEYLDQLPQRQVLVMLDDFFLRRRVNTSAILRCLAFSQARLATQVRLVARPGPTDPLPEDDLIGECAAGSPYRLSTQAAIWDRATLRALLCAGESIWEFEHNGNARVTAQAGGFYSVRRPVLPYEGWFAHHVVEKGRWFCHEKWIFARQNVGCDFAHRGTLPAGQTVFYHLAQLLDRSLNPLGWRAKNALKLRLRRWLDPLLGRQLQRLRLP